MVETTQHRFGDNSPGATLVLSRIWRVLFERQVCPKVMVVGEVFTKKSAKMPFSDHDDMICALTTNSPDDSLTVRILPRRPRADRFLSDTHAVDPANENVPVNSVVVADEILWFGAVARKRLDHLTGCPLCGRMGRDVEMHDLPTFVRHDDEAVQEPKRHGRNDEEVARCGAFEVVAQERHPGLARRSLSANPQEVSSDRSLREFEAELLEFSMHPRRTPGTVFIS